MFLMGMYDILEGWELWRFWDRRYGVMKKNVMHPNISPRNILVNLSSISSEALAEFTFVNTILDSSGQRYPPTALIWDLDNSSIYKRETDPRTIELPKSRTRRRREHLGLLLVLGIWGPSFSPMHELSDKVIAKRYIGYYRGEAVRTFPDDEGECHGGRLDELRHGEAYFSGETTKASHHQPRHDVESPKNRQDVEDSTEELKKMGPEYGFLEPPPAEDLLHEAFQRPILNQIIEMEKDIDLDTVDFRETPELRRADLQKMAVPFGPSVASDSPSKSEGRPTKRSTSTHGETHTINEPQTAMTAKTVENIATKELKRVRPGGATRSTRIKYFSSKTSWSVIVECAFKPRG
ncbi:hypothetical protein EDD85DRAFT_994864 [Armillaria nabsnona]|nr:hypothetical protein EDD85DRAFT_994864 [Armillaria nabsnona]